MIRSIAKPARQFPSTQAKSSNQPISFDTTSLSNDGSNEAARCVRAAMFSDRDLTGDGDGVGACACTVTGSSRITKRTLDWSARFRFTTGFFLLGLFRWHAASLDRREDTILNYIQFIPS